MLQLLASSPMMTRERPAGNAAAQESRRSTCGGGETKTGARAVSLVRAVQGAAGISDVMRDAARAGAAAARGAGAPSTSERSRAPAAPSPSTPRQLGVGARLPPADTLWNFGGTNKYSGATNASPPLAEEDATRRLGPVELRPSVPALPFTLFPAKEKAARAASKKRRTARKFKSLRDMQRAMQPTEEDIRAAYECEQKSDEWFQFREDRITGSCFGAAAGHCPYTKPDQLLQRQLWGSFVKSRHTEHGSFYEDEARQAYILWRMLQLASLARPRESDGGATRPLPEMLSRQQQQNEAVGDSCEPTAAPRCPTPPAPESSRVVDDSSAFGGNAGTPGAALDRVAAAAAPGAGSERQDGAAVPDVPFAEELRAVRRAAHADYWFDDMPAEPLASKPAVVEFDAPPVNAEALARLSGAEVDSREGQTAVTMDSRRKVVRVPFKCWECGIMLRRDLWYIGCSPDGLVEECGEEGCLEIKCPSSKRDFYANDKRYARTGIPPQYFDQIQGLMHFAQRAWCDFVVYVVVPNSQRRRMWVRRYMYDRKYCTDVLFPKLDAWYMKRYVPLRLAQLAGRLAEGSIKLPLRFSTGTLEAAWGKCSAWASKDTSMTACSGSNGAGTDAAAAASLHEGTADDKGGEGEKGDPEQPAQSCAQEHGDDDEAALSLRRETGVTVPSAPARAARDLPETQTQGRTLSAPRSPLVAVKRQRQAAVSAGAVLHGEMDKDVLAAEAPSTRRRSVSFSACRAALDFVLHDAGRGPGTESHAVK